MCSIKVKNYCIGILERTKPRACSVELPLQLLGSSHLDSKEWCVWV